MAGSLFHPIRFGLKAVNLSALLILGHILLTTSAHSPQALHQTPDLPAALSVLSALIFLTLLWLSFTLLEGSDLGVRPTVPRRRGRYSPGEEEEEEEQGMVFCQTWIEGGAGLLALYFWIVYREQAQLVLSTYSAEIAKEFILIPITYHLNLLSLSLLNIHLLCAIVAHARRVGLAEVCADTFWTGRMGWWVGHVRLATRGVEDMSEKV
ncbi:hypothetical protein IAT38_002441 [Cryptococcus sp. DSM 104549]